MGNQNIYFLDIFTVVIMATYICHPIWLFNQFVAKRTCTCKNSETKSTQIRQKIYPDQLLVLIDTLADVMQRYNMRCSQCSK